MTKPPGRPSAYTDELANEICTLLTEGNSLRKICEMENMPSTSMVTRWLADDRYSAFRSQYARAKDDSADSYADRIADIGEKVLKGEYDPQAARVAVDSLKWAASKLKPKKYGDRLDLGNANDKPFVIEITQ